MQETHYSVASRVDANAAHGTRPLVTGCILVSWKELDFASNKINRQEVQHIKDSERMKVRPWLACQETSNLGRRAVLGLGQGQKGPMVMRVMLKVSDQTRNGQ